MLVVSNTSPISNLAIIGRLDFLLRRYGTVHIPPEVADELAALTHPAGSQRIQTALASHWLKVKSLKHPVTSLIPFRLDPGETNAIAFAASSVRTFCSLMKNAGEKPQGNWV